MYFLQLLIRKNIGHACIFIVHDGNFQGFTSPQNEVDNQQLLGMGSRSGFWLYSRVLDGMRPEDLEVRQFTESPRALAHSMTWPSCNNSMQSSHSLNGSASFTQEHLLSLISASLQPLHSENSRMLLLSGKHSEIFRRLAKFPPDFPESWHAIPPLAWELSRKTKGFGRTGPAFGNAPLDFLLFQRPPEPSNVDSGNSDDCHLACKSHAGHQDALHGKAASKPSAISAPRLPLT